MDRAEWQKLAEDRLADAHVLLDAGRWSAAYYLAGYAVECGLKSCIVAHLAGNAGIIFEQRNYSDECWNHDVDKLIRAAGFEQQRKTDSENNQNLANNWLFVKDWKETSRYEQKSELDARSLCAAVTDTADGVLQWIKSHW